jgi:ElaB/YqjD/DUF883 family membrane-anchored ribosome-binding protein
LAGLGGGHERQFVRQGYVSFKKNDAWHLPAAAPSARLIFHNQSKIMSEKEAKHAAEKFKSGKSHATEAAAEFKQAAAAKFSDLRDTFNERAGEYRDRANQAWSDTTGRARTLTDDGEEYIRENPLQAVGIALAAGFILGVIMRR